MDIELHEDTSETLQPAPAGCVWMVVHARPRCEKRITAYCDRNDIRFYFPLRRKTHRYGRRERIFHAPLFPGYVFCVLTPQQKLLMKQNNHVANVLDVLEQSVLVNQLRQVEQALSVGDVIEVMPYLETGRSVRVASGPMKGVEGFVVRLKGKTKVVISVDMIRKSVAMEIDNSFLVPA